MTTEAAPIPASVWRIALVLTTGGVLAGLDTSLINVGMDVIGKSLDASLAATQWVSSGYLLALAAALPACGWLGRRFGSGRVWSWALAGFTLSSALCAFAPDIGLLIAARALQGLTGGVLIPAGMAIIGGLAGPGGMGRLIAISSVPAILAPAFGPVIGALLIANLSWHWLFLVNVPIGLAGLLAGHRWVPAGERATDADTLDLGGLVLVGAGLPLTVYAITEVTGTGVVTDPAIWLPLLVGVVALGWFGRRSLRREHPLLDLRLVRNPVFGAASVEVFFGGAALFGGLIVMPLYFQLALGSGIVDSGLLLMAFSLGAAATFPIAGSLTDRFGGGIVCAAGLLVVIATTIPMALLPDAPDLVLVEVLQVLRGIGMALSGAAVSAALAAVDRNALADASAQINVLSRIGGALGGAIFVVLLSADPDPAAFRRTFWLLAAATAAALIAALRLARAQRPRLNGEVT